MKNNKIKVGDLVHWYEYSIEQVITDGGWGTVTKTFGSTVEVLTVKGLREIPADHCDIEDLGCEK